ncbi:hypothetical protein BH10BAC3_BH10BAC3_28230 [soil metagenome]
MKKIRSNKHSILLIALFFLLQPNSSLAQEDTVAQPVVKLHYFNNNNKVQYLILTSMLKKNKKLTPQKNKTYQLFIDSSSSQNLVAKLLTDENGKAKAFIPPSLKTAWDATAKHTFIVLDGKEEVISDFVITKAKINLSTGLTDSVKNITASVLKLENNEWIPAADVEIKIGIERLGSILSAGDAETYTTDSTGTVTVELKKDSLPGDTHGNYIIAAKVEDNDEYGNLLVEKSEPWGVLQKIDTNFFNQRTLWTTRFRTPYWLLLMAYSIIIAVWGTLLYLIIQLVKIKRIGVNPVH